MCYASLKNNLDQIDKPTIMGKELKFSPVNTIITISKMHEMERRWIEYLG
jgi:hypothetical protein